MTVLRNYTKPKVFGTVVVSALVLGALLGVLAKVTEASWLTETLDTIGTVFTSLLQFTVIPLVFTAIIVGITSLRKLGGARVAARLGGKTLLWFATTSLIAVVIGLAIGLIGHPGSGVHVTPDAESTSKIASKEHGSWTALLSGIVPDNFFSAFSEGNILQVVFLALIVGMACFALQDKAAPFVNLNQAVFDIIQKILRWIIQLAPIGVLGLIGNAFATYGDKFLRPLLSLIVAVYLGCAIVLFVVYPVLLRFVGKTSPRRFFAKTWNTLQFAFVSRSSSASLPLARQAAVDLGVESGYAGFAVPLGSTTKMDGCAAIYPAIATIFIANILDVHLAIWQYILIAVVAVFGALATAGTTGWFTMLTLTLGATNMPPAVVATGLAIVIGVDPIMDMMRTATNVAGQITVPVLVASGEGLIEDRSATNEPDTDPRESTSEPETEEALSTQSSSQASS